MANDVTVTWDGALCLLVPATEAGLKWLNENIGKDNGYQPWRSFVIVEPRYTADIVKRMFDDGLEVAWE